MLAALIASQSIVTFVAAAPAPPEKPEFLVNVPHTFYNAYPKEVQKFKCFIAKDNKNACTNPSTAEILEAVDFLAENRLCKAINGKIKVNFDNVAGVKDCPLEAYCYLRTFKCGEITKANLPELNGKDLAAVNAICYASYSKGNCKHAIDSKLCNQILKGTKEDRRRQLESEQAESSRRVYIL